VHRFYIISYPLFLFIISIHPLEPSVVNILISVHPLALSYSYLFY